MKMEENEGESTLIIHDVFLCMGKWACLEIKF